MTAFTALAIILVFFVLTLWGLLSVLRGLMDKTHEEPLFRDGDDERVGDVSQTN